MSAFRRSPWVIALWIVSSLAVGALLFWAYRRFVLLHPDPTMTFHREGSTFELLEPRMLGTVLVAPWFILVLSKSLADLPWPQKVLAVLLRIAFVVLLGLSLSRLARTATASKVCTVYIVDVSDSVPDEALEDARQEVIRALEAKKLDDEVKLITFARRPRVIPVDANRASAVVIERHRAAPSAAASSSASDKTSEPGAAELGAGSNLQAALQLAYGLYPPGYVKRAVLVSDGVQTDGDVLAEANRAKDFGVRLFTIPYRRPVPGEVAVRELVLPQQVRVGETFEVRANVYASQATKAKATLYQDKYLNGLQGMQQVELKRGDNDVVFKSVVRLGGPVTYRFELDDIGVDRFAENNRYATTVDVPGKPRVLLVDSTPQHVQPLASALTAQQLEVDVRAPVGFPGSDYEINQFDFVIVSDTPRSAMPDDVQQILHRYVSNGGGFLFAGGEGGYALGGWYNSTIAKMLPVSMETKDENEEPSVALLLVIDRSGSMTGLPMEMAKSAAKATVDVLSPDDLLGVIAFDSSPTRFVKLQPARNRSRINGEISRIQPGGGTEIFSALDAAFQDMSVTQARRKHVILLTDGKAPTPGIREVVQAMVSEAITITSVGLGTELDEELLKMIADTGGGRYLPVADPNNLPRIFTKETEMVARAAAVEEWFPVVQVGPAAFLKGADVRTAPFLHGYVSTTMKESPAQELLQSEDTQEPILARWRVGLGWSLAWTSDVKSRWAVEWIGWQGWEKFWGQLVHEHMRQKDDRELDMKAEVVNGKLIASVDAFSPDERRFENSMKSKLQVRGPELADASAAPSKPTTPNAQLKCEPPTCSEIEFRQIAPGRYEAQMPLPKYGSYLLHADHQREQEDGSMKPIAISRGHVSNPYPAEYATFEGDRLALLRTAQAGNGTVDPELDDVFDPLGEHVTYHEHLWHWFIYAAIGVFLLDLLVRRVRIFDRKFVARSRRAAR